MRPRCRRRIRHRFSKFYYKPRGIPLSEIDTVEISDEELEALRLRYLEKVDQKKAAESMNISQSQYQRDLTNVLEKLTEALIKGEAIYIKPTER